MFNHVCRLSFFFKFQTTHPKASIEQRLFESLKLFFVKPMKDRNTCYCMYHVKLNELKLALNSMMISNTIHENQLCDYTCDVCNLGGHPCQASCTTYKGLTEFWEAIVCPKNDLMNGINKNVCLGTIPGVGYKCYHFVQRKFSSNVVLIPWRRFALKTTMARSGRALKKLTLVYKTTFLDEFIDYLKPKLQHFV